MRALFSGFHPVIQIVYLVAILFVPALLGMTVLSLLFQKYFFRRRCLPHCDPAWRPRCTIILPVKGVPKDLARNLAAYDALDYPDYEVIITVESDDDPAVAVATPLVERSPRISLVVAGLATRCAQKNHNMLAAIRTASNPEVYVFADADIAPSGHWLRSLVVPLSNRSLSATTGFRWLISKEGRIGELTHTNVNAFILVLFGFVSLLRLGSICWGGSMAIRRHDFEELKVAEKWARSGVDDISLSQVLVRNGRRSILVPDCITHTDDLIETTAGTVNWCARQIMFLKAYHRPLWLMLGALWCVALLLQLLLPLAAVLALIGVCGFLACGGGAGAIFVLGDLLTTLLYRLMGPVPRMHRLVALQPFFRTTHLASYAKTLFSRSIVWSGIRYTLAFNGDVTRVERLNQSDKQ